MSKEKVVLKNGETYAVDGVNYLGHLFEIHFSPEVDLNALAETPEVFGKITILTRGGNTSGEYEGYTTIYRIEDNKVTLSDDGTVYTEYVDDDNTEIDDSTTPVVNTVEAAREAKIASLSYECNFQIVNGVDISINGETQHFSYKDEDQNNIKDAFDLAFQTGMEIPYHADNMGCALYTADQIIALYVAEKTNLTHHQTYFNQLKMYVGTLDDIDTINNVYYGQELEGAYAENYNIMMAQAARIISALLYKPEEETPIATDDEGNNEDTSAEIENPDVDNQDSGNDVENEPEDPKEIEPDEKENEEVVE